MNRACEYWSNITMISYAVAAQYTTQCVLQETHDIIMHLYEDWSVNKCKMHMFWALYF